MADEESTPLSADQVTQTIFVDQDGTPLPTNGDDRLSPTDNVQNLAGFWPVFVLRGLVVTLFGLVFLFHPNATADLLAKLFGSLLIIEGAVNLVKTIMVCCVTDSFNMLCVYFLSFVANTTLGILVFVYPHETAGLLVLFIGVWFLAIGILQVFLSCFFITAQQRGLGGSLGIVGFAYVVIGSILLGDQEEGVETIGLILGAVITLFGLQLLCIGFGLKSIQVPPLPPYNSSEFTNFAQKQQQNDGGQGGTDFNVERPPQVSGVV